MLRNSLQIALRLMRRHKGYTAINVFGLSVGLACCILIFLFLQQEFTYDRFHEDGDRLFRLYVVENRPDGIRSKAGMSMPVAPAVASSVGSIEHAVRTIQGGGTVRVGDQSFQQSMLFVDEAFFETFSFPLVSGNPATALGDLQGVVISQDLATRYFGEEPALGKVLRMRTGAAFEDFVVGGVARKPPQNSSIRFNMVVRFEKHPVYARDHDNPDSFNSRAYVKLASGANVTATEAGVNQAARSVLHNLAGHLNDLMGLDRETGEALNVKLQPIRDMHLDARLADGRGGNRLVLWLLSLVALLVLGSGCINFINLSIGRSANRLGEIGIRKAVGAVRAQLIQQFWLETVLLSGIALLVGIALANRALPYFNQLVRSDLALDAGNPVLWLAMGALLVITAVAAGAYPALYLSRLRPAVILAGRSRAGGKSPLRSSLIVGQFMLAMMLMTALVTMNRQLDYLRNADPGFDQEQVVSIPISPGQHDTRFVELYKQRLSTIPGVVGATAASNGLGLGPDGSTRTSVLTFTHIDTDIAANILRIDSDYLSVLGLDLSSGRDFTALPADHEVVIVNEALFGLLDEQPEQGPQLTGFNLSNASSPEIIGVVKDFNFEALRSPVEPLVMFVDPRAQPFVRLFVRVRPENVAETLASMERHWGDLEPDLAFRSSFLDQDVDRQYTREGRQFRVAGIAMSLAMLIACLGLLGLAVLEGARRTKEVGVRKSLGASVPNLVRLLSLDFLRLVLIAFSIAAGPAWFLMDRWLSGFAYHITIGPGTIIVAGTLVMVLSWLTVGWQAFRTAMTDPVRALRYE